MTPSVEQKRVKQIRERQSHTWQWHATARNHEDWESIQFLLTLLDTLSQSLTEAQGEIARLKADIGRREETITLLLGRVEDQKELLTRSGKPDVERNFSIHAADSGEGSEQQWTAEELAAIRADYYAWFSKQLVWRSIETALKDGAYVLLASPAHGLVIGAHVTCDVWHFVGIGAISSESERPTHWMPLPAPPSEEPVSVPAVPNPHGEPLV